MTAKLLESSKVFGNLAVSDFYQAKGKLQPTPAEIPSKERKILERQGMDATNEAACLAAFRAGFEEGTAEMRAVGAK